MGNSQLARLGVQFLFRYFFVAFSNFIKVGNVRREGFTVPNVLERENKSSWVKARLSVQFSDVLALLKWV